MTGLSGPLDMRGSLLGPQESPSLSQMCEEETGTQGCRCCPGDKGQRSSLSEQESRATQTHTHTHCAVRACTLMSRAGLTPCDLKGDSVHSVSIGFRVVSATWGLLCAELLLLPFPPLPHRGRATSGSAGLLLGLRVHVSPGAVTVKATW